MIKYCLMLCKRNGNLLLQMADNQEKKMFMELRETISKKVNEKGISMAKLVREIEMTEPGFYKMLDNGSMKLKTLIKIADVLDTPPYDLFPSGAYQSAVGNSNVLANNSTISSSQEDVEQLKKMNAMLESQLRDKEHIIELLKRKD